MLQYRMENKVFYFYLLFKFKLKLHEAANVGRYCLFLYEVWVVCYIVEAGVIIDQHKFEDSCWIPSERKRNNLEDADPFLLSS